MVRSRSNAPQTARVPFDPKAIFTAFLEKVPQPPGRPDTAETIDTLKMKGIELRNRLAALEPLKGTPAWTTDQEASIISWIFSGNGFFVVASESINS
jgi:hypothetical protein